MSALDRDEVHVNLDGDDYNEEDGLRQRNVNQRQRGHTDSDDDNDSDRDHGDENLILEDLVGGDDSDGEDEDEDGVGMNEEDLHVSEVEVRERRWFEVLFALRWPFSYVIVGLSLLLALILGGALAMALTLFPDSELEGETWTIWLALALAMLGVYIGLHMIVGSVIYVLGYRFLRTKAFYFASGLRNSSVFFGWGIVGIIVSAIFMSDLSSDWEDGLRNFWVCVIVVSACYGLRVIFEKMAILGLSNNMHRRVSESIFQEKVLFKLLTAIERAADGGGSSRASRGKSLRRATVGSVKKARKAMHAGSAAKKLLVNESMNMLSDMRGDVRSHRSTLDGDESALSRMQNNGVLRGWSFVREPDPVKIEGKVPLSAEPLLEEKQRKREEQQAKLIGSLVYDYLDSESKGYVLEEDFAVVYPDRPYQRQQAFFAFNPNLLRVVSRDDVRDTVQRIYRQREAIRRGLSDRADVSAIVRKLSGSVFWTLMFVVVLIIFGVDVVAVVLPYVSLMLAFSFAFGPTLRVLLESAIHVLVLAPYDVGDRVVCDGSNGIVIVDRITLFTTYAHSPLGEQYALPNAAIYRGVVRNHHRSLPFGLLAAVDVVPSTPSSALVQFISNVKEFCTDSDTFLPNPSAWIDDIEGSNAIRIRFQVMTRAVKWSQVPKVRRALSVFNQFVAQQLGDLGLDYRLPDQPIIMV